MAKTKTLISFAVTAKLICVFVFAYAKKPGFSRRGSNKSPSVILKTEASVGSCARPFVSDLDENKTENGSSRVDVHKQGEGKKKVNSDLCTKIRIITINAHRPEKFCLRAGSKQLQDA